MQNRSKIIDLFTGNLANAIVHTILEEAIDSREIADRYRKEQTTSKEIAIAYRKKINPADFPLPEKEIKYIKDRLKRKVNSELNSRITKGYQNINLDRVDELIDKYLKEFKVTESIPYQ